MKIQRVLIDGFKNLSNVDMTFGRMTSIVSINNFGKSNFLQGINFGVQFIKATPNQKVLMLQAKNVMPFNKSNFGKSFKFEIETNVTFNETSYSTIYSLEATWGYKPEDVSIKKEVLKIKKNEPYQKYEMVLKRTDNSCLYKASLTGRCSTALKLEPMELGINKLRAFDNLYFVDIIKKFNDLSLYMEDTLDPRAMYNADPVIIKGIGDVMFMSNNLPRVLYKLKEIDINRYELIKNTFMALFPNVIELNVEELKVNVGNAKLPDDSPLMISDSIYVLSLKDKNLVAPLNFEAMSDGAKRILVLLTRIILAEMSNVALIAIEEPENSIHPSLLNSYIQVISQLLDDSKLVFTSHSPYIISYLPNESVYAGLPDGEGGAIFKRVKTNVLSKDAAEVDELVGDYLFSLLSDDSDMIKDYIED